VSISYIFHLGRPKKKKEEENLTSVPGIEKKEKGGKEFRDFSFLFSVMRKGGEKTRKPKKGSGEMQKREGRGENMDKLIFTIFPFSLCWNPWSERGGKENKKKPSKLTAGKQLFEGGGKERGPLPLLSFPSIPDNRKRRREREKGDLV